ncbi:hypothetical protein ACET3X_007644 [Alternaria dauci]|uniref:Fungal N-terminal domain-containing protein n=1 Tax=Alternaria dauci TaxID=48095 RepID=A0ABR3UCK0_9PLEO
MAEVIGLAASIIQIAGAGAKLSVALYNFTNSAAQADQEIRDIADDVDLTSNALESVGKVFESEDAKSIVSKKAVQDAHKIIKKCQGVFDELSGIVEKRRKMGKDGKKTLSMMGKLAWPMKEQRVELNRRRLESLKNSLVLLLHVLQLAQGQSRGKMEKRVMEEERNKIRELHQLQQDSLKSLQALESRLGDVALDEEETLKGSTSASRIPTLELVANAQTMEVPPLEKHINCQEDTVVIGISGADDSDTSDSDATMTDEDDEHISIEELSKAATHVTKLLRRITVLKKSIEDNQKCHRKRRVHKIYQRFCRKFESGINVAQAAGPSEYRSPVTRPSDHDKHAFDLNYGEGDVLENFDFDSFLHAQPDSTPFPVVPPSPPPQQYLNGPRPEEPLFASNHSVPNMGYEAFSSWDAHFQMQPSDDFIAYTAPALDARSHQNTYEQLQNTEAGASSRQGSRPEEHDGGKLPEDQSLRRISFRSTKKRWRPAESIAVRRRKSHLQAAAPILDAIHTPAVRHPLDDGPEHEADLRSKKRPRINSDLDAFCPEGAHSALLQKREKAQTIKKEEALDSGDRDIIDVLLEQWTVLEYRRS